VASSRTPSRSARSSTCSARCAGPPSPATSG